MDDHKINQPDSKKLRQLPLVTIVTPNFNNDKYIGETIESVLNQNYKRIEYIIVDDGSTDNSLKIIRDYVKKYPGRIKLISQQNMGQSRAVNVGFKHARGQIVGWINSDDTYCKGAVSTVLDVFTEHKEIKIVFGNYVIIDDKGNTLKKVKQLPIDLLAGCFLGFGRLVASNSIFWDRSLFNKIGYLNEDFDYNMDGEYFSRLFFASEAIHIKRDIANFRLHKGSKTSDCSQEKIKRLKLEFKLEVRKSYKRLLISKFLPFEISPLFRLFFKCKRGVWKFFYNFC